MEYQHSLFTDSGEANVKPPQLVDDRLPDEAIPRLTRQGKAILELLQTGPQRNIDLLPISTRFSARIYELRKAGYVIETDQVDRKNGISIYTLKGKK